MAATAQDPSAPLRAEKKDEDRDEDSACLIAAPQHCTWVLRAAGCVLRGHGALCGANQACAPCLTPTEATAFTRSVLLGAVEYSPFYGIEKGAVLQEARIFNDPHIDPRRCQQVRAVTGQKVSALSIWHV